LARYPPILYQSTQITHGLTPLSRIYCSCHFEHLARNPDPSLSLGMTENIAIAT
jgi:hypothetical protein